MQTNRKIVLAYISEHCTSFGTKNYIWPFLRNGLRGSACLSQGITPLPLLWTDKGLREIKHCPGIFCQPKAANIYRKAARNTRLKWEKVEHNSVAHFDAFSQEFRHR